MPKQKGLFVISLDFELLWGVRDKKSIETYGENLRGVRKVIPELLKLFSRYEIHATFATVGFLFCRNKAELLNSIPEIKPSYSHKKYSPYENQYLESIGESESEDIYHYASSLVELIQSYPNQEIASHTLSHFYALENASLEAFESDLITAKSIADTYGITLKSIVLPRNQYSSDHIQVCKKQGFLCFRGNEKASMYHPRKNDEQNKRIRALRLIDAYINISGHNTYKISKRHRDIINLPSSRFLRPYNPQLKFLEQWRLNRIKQSMTYAAKRRQVYHLWWHPHNFGINIKENFAFLEEILKHYTHLNLSYDMESRNMGEIAAEFVKKEHEA